MPADATTLASSLPMSLDEMALFFRALADRTRLAIVRLLIDSDLRVGEIVERMALPQNAVSYHLKQLRAAGLLRDRRSSADARDIYYSIDLERMQAFYRHAGEALQVVSLLAGEGRPTAPEPARPLRILYLCTHNSARSQFAEALTRQYGGPGVVVFSAGDTPTVVHPLTSALLAEWQIDPARQASKALDQFLSQSFDYVITVCDRVREHCPTFPGAATQLHWSIPDPTDVADEEARRAAFRAVRHEVSVRVRHLLRQHHVATTVAA